MKLSYDDNDDDQDLDINESDLDLGDLLSQEIQNIEKQNNNASKLSQTSLNGNNGNTNKDTTSIMNAKEFWIQRGQKQGNGNIQMTDDQYNFGDMKGTLAEEQPKRIIPKTIDLSKNGDDSTSNVNIPKFRGGFKKGDKPVFEVQKRLELKSELIVSKQHQFLAEGLNVYFPFKPYQCQIDFMSRVIKALNTGENALLESPTGTGKTLSLLCGTLAWLRHARQLATQQQQMVNVPRIIYTSRTHSQLAQVQRELKNTAYDPRSIVIGSRDHFCVHPEIKLLRGHALNSACQKSQRGLDPCQFFKNRDLASTQLTWEPLDIEELHKIGVDKTFCPFYANKDRIEGADIVFMPYNYLIDEKIRENFKIDYTNSIIIFDEAHNVTSTAEDVASFELPSKTLETAIMELQKVKDEMQLNDDHKEFKSSDEDCENLLIMWRNFHSYLENYDLNQQSVKDFRIDTQYLNQNSMVLPGLEIFKIMKEGTKFSYLDRVNQEQRDSNIFLDWIRWSDSFQRILDDIQIMSNNVNTKTSIETLYDVIKKIIRLEAKQTQKPKKGIETQAQNEFDNFYVYMHDEEDNQNNQMTFGNRRKGGNVMVRKQTQRVLAFWCFNAGIGFRDIQELNPRSIILTSGTLSPLNSFQAELQLNFTQRLENPHVISPDQVSINILTRGAKDSNFNFSYQNRDNEFVLNDLGMTIANIAEITPGGMLIFFPSYRVMQKCDETWTNSGAKNQIEKFKKVFMEPKDQSLYQKTMDRYYQSIFSQKTSKNGLTGAILMGVCRGRISEGLDFSDNAARCVIIIGIPYPQMTDPKVILKKDFLDKKFNQKRTGQDQFQTLLGKDWYSQQATRAVNQAIGRVIRHVQDYGSIILIDERYNWGTMRNQISKWLRDRIQVHQKPFDMQNQLQAFYENMKSKGFKAKVEQLGQVQLELEGDGLGKKISDAQSSEDEEAKGDRGHFMQNAFKNRNQQDQPLVQKNKGVTISQYFRKGEGDRFQKRTLKEVDQGFGLKIDNKRILSKRTYQKNDDEPVKSGGLGFCTDSLEHNIDENQEISKNKKSPMLIQPQDSEQFGMKANNFQGDLRVANKTASLNQFSYKPSNKSLTTNQRKNDTTMIPNSNNASSISEKREDKVVGGIYSTNTAAIQDKEKRNKLLIENCKKILAKEQMVMLPSCIKELKMGESVQPAFQKLRHLFFGKLAHLKSDKQFSDKFSILQGLGSTISNSQKHKEFQQLLKDCQSS